MKKLSLIIIISSLALTSFAQDKREERREKKEAKRQKINEMVRQAEEGVLIYQKQSIFGIQLRTNGYGAFYELGRMKSNRKTTIYRIDITEIKNSKEEKILGGSFIFGNPYVYGKINNFYPVTLGFGQQYIFGQKGNKNGVAVTGIYNAGLSLGLLRPYYLNVEDANGEEKSIKYSVEDSILFLDQGAIISGGGFGKGWSEIKVKPGAFAKVGMRFDFGRYNESVSALEIGMSVEAYASKIQIMALQKDKRMFFQGYIAFLFGRRK
ncbi:MAG: hypothetical protein ACXWV6_06985 [Chitinophagaceae bacterium]